MKLSCSVWRTLMLFKGAGFLACSYLNFRKSRILIMVGFTDAGFSQWGFVLTCSKTHRLKPAPLLASALFAYTPAW
jgi:hypothetical protein